MLKDIRYKSNKPNKTCIECLTKQANFWFKTGQLVTNLVKKCQFSRFSHLGCIAPLGMAFGAISDYQISASSQQDGNHIATQGRLHFKGDSSKAGCWSALNNDANQWLQVDFGSYTRVTGVATQGRYDDDQWVTKYRLQYSDDGMTFQVYKKTGEKSTKVFPNWHYSFLGTLILSLEIFVEVLAIKINCFTSAWWHNIKSPSGCLATYLVKNRSSLE